ncbi:RHS repeat-associated core domain-containing protein [Bordetella bronchialis]|uniref:RHS repeat-associated core domain-containing protein n=1 Tax=Bordetella bronchialis TaxID=463025 RepID=A0A193FUU8_9BORD|nr:RHS repeat-associated core domain-containing protein [Bordetella bronchialis]ANN71415.1 hypothetical protein BAU08_08810 [Bordetella bronchialis]
MADTRSLRYAGYYADRPTGAYALGNGYRIYLPGSMRFASPDSLSPFGRGGLNAYAYCRGDPVDGSDPGGHIRLGELMEDAGESASLLQEQASRPASRSSTRSNHGMDDGPIGAGNAQRDTSPPAPLGGSRRTTRRSSDRDGLASPPRSRAGTPLAGPIRLSADDTGKALLQPETVASQPLPAALAPTAAESLQSLSRPSSPSPPPGPRSAPAADELALSFERLLSAGSLTDPRPGQPDGTTPEAIPAPRITAMPARLYPRTPRAAPWRAFFDKAAKAYDAWRHPDPWLD